MEERKKNDKTKEEILDFEHKLFKYLQKARLIVLMLDCDCNVKFINNKGAEILEGKDENIIGKNWIDLFIPEDDKDMIKTIFSKSINKNLDMEDYFENEVITLKNKKKYIGWYNDLLFDDNDKIVGVISSGIDVTEKRNIEKQMEHLASIDEMTGIYNRRMGMEFLQKKLELSKRNKKTLSTVVIDVNDFKYVNDKFGYKSGDSLLIKLSNIINNNLRSSDILARIGGDEFLIILPECEEQEAKKIINRILKEIKEINSNLIQKYNISISYGIASSREEKTVENIIASADVKMYQMKKEYKKQK